MKIKLPNHRDQHWRDTIKDLLHNANTGWIDLDCGEWSLTYTDLQDLMAEVEQSGRRLDSLISNVPDTCRECQSIWLRSKAATDCTNLLGGPHAYRPPNEGIIHTVNWCDVSPGHIALR